MKRLALMAITSGAAIAVATPAVAAPYINIITGSGIYGNDNVTCSATAPCPFSDTFTFTTPTGYNLLSLTLSSTQVGNDATTNIDFSSVTLNGVNFSTVLTGTTEFRMLMNQVLTAGGTNTLILSGMSGGNGSYSGALSFSFAAVPEPATWGLMIAGFGAMGTMMRRRKTSVAFA